MVWMLSAYELWELVVPKLGGVGSVGESVDNSIYKHIESIDHIAVQESYSFQNKINYIANVSKH